MRIDIRILNLGMSGAKWMKTGGFEKPGEAAAFLFYWWQHLSAPEGWELKIDGMDYEVVPAFPREKAEAHIHYCCEFHGAFYGPVLAVRGSQIASLEKGTVECL